MKKYKKWFFEEHDDNGGGSRGTSVFEDDPIEPTTEKEGEKIDSEPKVEAAPVVVDPAALAASFGDVLAARFPQQPESFKKEEKELTQEEAKKLLNVWEPTEDWIKKFDNLETRGAALSEQRDGLIRHADTIAQFRLREQEKALDERYAPVIRFMEEFKQQQATERFQKTYPELADEKLSPLVDAVATNLKKQGKTYTDEKTLFQDLAQGMEAVIKVANPAFKLSAGSTPAEKTKAKGASTNGIPVTTPGSGGSNAARGQTVDKKRGLAIFD